jgi:hypothetical protein
VGMKFTLGGPTVQVRWFRCLPGALPLPTSNLFFSRNWEDKADRFDELGEQSGPRPWSRGVSLPFAFGKHLCDQVEWFSQGVPASALPIKRPVTQQGLPLCCLRPPEGLPVGQIIQSGDGWYYNGVGGVLCDSELVPVTPMMMMVARQARKPFPRIFRSESTWQLSKREPSTK